MAESSIAFKTLGRYHVLEQIGQGGMASVYKAYDPTEDKNYAIKVLPPFLAQEAQFSKRFEREAEVVMRLQHPNIVPVVDFGQENGSAYLVMPLLEVGSLADRMQEGPLSPVEGGRVLEQLSGALDFAHQEGVIHRDVKPSNVLMDDQGNALLADFGLARIHDASVSLTGSALLGTPAYMSPEQAQGKKAGPASDQYSMGVILYQLCTGNLPFEAETPMAVLLKHISEPLPLARVQSPNVPEGIERVILKSTAKEPEERFASLGEMNLAFQAALAHSENPFSNPAPTIELPPSAIAVTAELEQESKKRKRLARLAAAAALLLLLGLACPLSPMGISNLINRASSPAEGSMLSPEDMSGPQLTALAGTIEVLTTQLAASGEGTQSPEQINTAVMETLIAEDDELFAVSSGTPGMPIDSTGTPAHTTTPGPSPTPSKSPTPGPSPTASKTPTITRTPTPGPSPTASKTSTATFTPGVLATSTSTPTGASTPTPTQVPTDTPMPPTSTSSATPTPSGDVCSTSSLNGFSVGGKDVSWTLNNGGSTTIEITETIIDWPGSNDELIKVYLGGTWIWDETDGSPPTTLGTDWEGGSRMLSPGVGKPLKFEFDVNAAASGYSLTVTLNDTCELSSGG